MLGERRVKKRTSFENVLRMCNSNLEISLGPGSAVGEKGEKNRRAKRAEL